MTDKVKNYYQGKAGELKGFFENPERQVLIEPVIDQINNLFARKKEPLNILGLGTGTGVHAYNIAKMGHSVDGVEMSEEMIGNAREKYQHENLTFINDSAPNLSKVKGNKYDLSILSRHDSIYKP